MSTSLLTARHLHLHHAQRNILSDVSLSVAERKIVTLIGPNGAGKSTLIRVLLGLQKAASGEIWRKPGLRIGYMPQRLVLSDQLPLTVRRFLALVETPQESDLQEIGHQTGILHLLEQPMQSLSGGEHQRVLLARALLRKPQLLVLDEPVQGVDVTGQAALYHLIADLRDRQGCAVLMVSHDLHLVMAQTDEVICLNTHVCCSGHPEHVSRDPAYLELFGCAADADLALYTHHHDHTHDALGEELPGIEHVHHAGCAHDTHADAQVTISSIDKRPQP
jgi:zinc transport system ATP-binding protein